MPSPLIQFRADETILPNIVARAAEGEPQGQAARRDLERYYEILRRELRGLAGDFALGEWSLMFDAANGVSISPETLRHFNHEIADHIELNGADRRFDVDADALNQKLEELTLMQLAAIVDACERFWNYSEKELSADGLAHLGIVVTQ